MYERFLHIVHIVAEKMFTCLYSEAVKFYPPCTFAIFNCQSQPIIFVCLGSDSDLKPSDFAHCYFRSPIWTYHYPSA